MLSFAAQLMAAQAADVIVPLETPSVEWAGLVPLIVLAGGAVVLLMAASLIGKWVPQWAYAAFTALVGVWGVVACVSLWDEIEEHGPYSTLANAVGVDGFSVFLSGVICCMVVLASLLAYDYLRREQMSDVEYYVLLLLSASGGVIMAGANDLIVMFVGIEILSIAVYVLAAMHLGRVQSQEAGFKYFVLGAFASAFLLYGIALVYGATGSTNLVAINQFLGSAPLERTGLLFGGFALMLVGLGFKIAAVPFHAWTPDVYEGAPSPVVAYMASGVKVAGFAALLRIFTVGFADYSDDWRPIVYALAVASMVVGSLFAIVQDNVKRMLAYSSISHAGFILIGVQVASTSGTEASLFYLAAYSFMVAGSFAVVTVMGQGGDDKHELEDYRGLASRRPVLAFAFTVFLLAQAGIPFTTGFFAKLYVIAAAIEDGAYILGVIAMVSAVIAAFLYLRIVLAMYGKGGNGVTGAVPFGAKLALAITLAFTLFFGIFPAPIVDVARDAIPVLVDS